MNRRNFIKRGLAAAAGLGMAPALFTRTAHAAGGNGKILVVFHLFGGNDAINNVIPYTQSEYYDYRPDISIPTDKIITLDAPGVKVGLHPVLKPLMDDFWQHGELAIINQVGYPNHNRSHFYSSAIWASADPDQISKQGWIGSFVDEQNDPFCATSLGSALPRALRGLHTSGLSINHIEEFTIKNKAARDELVRQIGTPRSGLAEETRKAMDHMMRSISKMEEARQSRYKPSTKFPRGYYGMRFSDISRLIKFNFDSQVYYVYVGGWDTHAGQGGAQGTHANVLKQIAQSMAAFRTEMKLQGRWDDVMIMVFSEFGRRAMQNASKGTDHGKGGVLYVAGGGVKGGLYGGEPSLQEEDLDEGDLPIKIDFRTVYAAAAQHIGANPADLVGPNFGPIDII